MHGRYAATFSISHCYSASAPVSNLSALWTAALEAISSWVPAVQMGGLNWRVWHSLRIVGIWEVKQQVKDLSSISKFMSRSVYDDESLKKQEHRPVLPCG